VRLAMQSNWPLVPVGDCCDLIVDCVNKTAPVVEYETPYKMIRTTNVRNGFIDLNGCKYVNESTFLTWTRRASVLDGDVLLTREAPIGEVGLVRGNQTLFLGQRLMQYRANRSLLDPRFLCYAFLSPHLQHQFGAHEGSGSTVSHIRVGDCSKFKIPLPPLAKQREIADLLGALDERLLLLDQSRCNLESIAGALFKSWFIDFDPVRAKAKGQEPERTDAATAALFPASFEQSTLGLIPLGWTPTNLGSLLRESTARVGKNTARVLSAVQSGELVRSEEHFNKRVHSQDISNYKAVDPLAFAYNPSRINIGSIGLNEHEGLGAVSPIYVVALAASTADAYFVWHQLRTAKVKQWIQTLCSGTVRQSLSFNDFSSIPLVLPPRALLGHFYELRKSLYSSVEHVRSRSRNLVALRNELLPRLISGKLCLPEAHTKVEEAIA
jgi:type I restriction enzyme, S subunit